MRLSSILIALSLTLSACSMSVTSLPSVPQQPAENTPVPPTLTPYPDTPAPEAIDAPHVESPALAELHFLNELDGWALSESQIIRTNDGGLNWYDVTPPDIQGTNYPGELFVLDNNHAWLQKADSNNYPNNGLLYRTSDGGLNWSVSSTPFSEGDLSFLNLNQGWMLANLGVGAGSNAVAVFQTTDGGETWTRTYINDPTSPEAGDSLPLGGIKSGIVPYNMQTAWVSGVIYASGTIYLYRTDDGGNNWSQVNPPLPAGAKDAQLSIDPDQIKFLSPKDGFLVVRMSTETGAYTTQSLVYVTSDGGNSWTLTPTLIPARANRIFCRWMRRSFITANSFTSRVMRRKPGRRSNPTSPSAIPSRA